MTFHDPIKSTVPTQQKNSPWDFRAPKYDQRSSNYVNAGSHYGVGFNNPVGHTSKAKQRVPTMPFAKRTGMEVDQVPRKNLKQEYEV